MPRPKKAPVTQSVSLFPFLAVLACVVGSLVFIISALALAQVGQTDIEASARVAALETQTRTDQKKADELQSLINETEAILARLAATSNSLANLHEQQPPTVKKSRDAQELLEEIGRLESEQTNLDSEVKSLQADYIRQLQRKPGPTNIVVLPGGSGTNVAPRFVECTSDGLILHSLATNARKVIPKAEIAADPTYSELLRSVNPGLNETVVFLLRRSGVVSYELAALQAEKAGCKHGKLPLPAEGELDFKHFKGR